MIEITNKFLTGYTYVDLFCGIGGFHIALSSFGANCVFASDIDKYAQISYQKNFGIQPSGDITKIDTKDIPKHDILCAGFPCQPFSISGNQQGFEDELGRGQLFFNIIDIIQEHRPRMVLLENVKNLEKHDNGNTLLRIKTELKKEGYTVFSKVLCAADYNIPQARQRIYIVAFHHKLGVDEFEFPTGLNGFSTLESILIQDINNDIPGNYYINREYIIKDDAVAQSKKLLRIGQIGLGRQGERIYSIKGLASTLSSQGGGLGGKTGMYLINGHVRKLYPRECARLMGFPDSFILAQTQEKCYNQFGNSVVVDVLQHIINKTQNIWEGDKNGTI